MQQPPAPPPTPAPVPPISAELLRRQLPGAAGPSEVYDALREQRDELRNQLENLEEKRQELRQELQQGEGEASNAGVLARIRELDARISATDAQIAEANLAVARAAAIPGAVVEPPPEVRSGPPEEAFVLGALFMVVTLLPLSIAYARRIWRRGATVIAPVPSEVRQQIDSLSNAVETIAHEVERIGEGQRFITKVLAEKQPEAVRLK